MNVILFTDADKTTNNTIVLRDQRHHQILNIHGSQVGDSVKVGELNGLIGSGIIEAIDQHAVTLAVDLYQTPPVKLPLTIILALPRPKMIRRIFRTVAELGVTQLIIINSYKVEKSFWQSPAINEDKVRQYLIDGLQQSKDTVLPGIAFKPRFKPFVEDELPAIIKGTKALLAHPATGQHCPHQLDEAVTLAIGPEGGFTEYEAEKLLAIGFEGIHLGERILKVENALTTLVAKLYS
ncbi:16S rRNA (uracil(1498)-N(3))-methyltransferase [Oceanicoccus sp. KOV_DT_Chl]|uniref:16S rRNA (uracil(1498)-N(3))-methyltransferase n=1 Tax=Oceanicoccus sp. KOV_DT_Chl TaxID=1904639 RepID=UPI000C7AC1ED|nr:16S rRNA (uracil(1498)-N(3))-methyltransferase [Oceanicoccus sp. KOV_DT_Chl]